MASWLVHHAAENVWCRPSEDGRFIIKPQRLCDKRGDIVGVQVSGHHIHLPDRVSWFHTYQIGKQDPEALGFEIWGGWRSAKDLVNRNGVVIIAYTESGRQIPLDLVHFRYISNHNLIVSVKRYETQVNLGKEDLYIKIYKGQYQNHADWTEQHAISCESFVVRKPEDITGLLVRAGQAAAKPGRVLYTVNGYPVSGFTSTNVKPWDYVEYLHDGTMMEVRDFFVDELDDFFSTLDGVKKLLVHFPKKLDQILHLNDLELYLYKGDVGRFVHTHLMADLRQLTHRDFSVGAAHLYNYGVTNPEWWATSEDLRLRIYVRNPALDQSLQFDANRILELYKMSDDDIISAMVGPDDSLEFWRAATLEQAPYSRLINALPPHITRKLVTDAYGYNAASRLLGYNHIPVIYDTLNRPRAPLGHLMMQQSTVFEYDVDGLLLGYAQHDIYSGAVYECKYPNTKFVEPIEGVGTRNLDIEFGMTMTKVNPRYQYRYYVDETTSEVPQWQYTEVTDSNAYDVLADNTVVWHIDPTRFLPVRQCDRTFLVNEFEFDYEELVSGSGLLYFNAMYDNRYNGKQTPLEFHPETVEVWLQGHSLTVGVDVAVDWPRIGICAKSILGKYPAVPKLKVVLRARNFLPRGVQYTMPKHGFVYDGLLSNNSVYDLRDDKVVRIIAGGRMYDRSDVKFREDVPVLLGNKLVNGTPYQITDPLIPLREQIEYPTYPFHAIAKAVDLRVEDYLTQKLPQRPAVSINPIPNRYVIFSLMINKLVLDILNGEFHIEERPDNVITSTELEERMQPYLQFLRADVAYLGVDDNYVVVYPLAVNGTAELYPLEYSFIERVNSTYFNDRVILNTQLKVKDRPK